MSNIEGNNEYLNCEELIERYSQYLKLEDIVEVRRRCNECEDDVFTKLRKLNHDFNQAFMQSFVTGELIVPKG